MASSIYRLTGSDTSRSDLSSLALYRTLVSVRSLRISGMNSSVSRTWSVNRSNCRVARTNVGNIWSVVRVTNWSVVLSVRCCSYEAQVDCWTSKGHVEWSVHEVRIPNIDESCVVSVVSSSVVENA